MGLRLLMGIRSIRLDAWIALTESFMTRYRLLMLLMALTEHWRAKHCGLGLGI